MTEHELPETDPIEPESTHPRVFPPKPEVVEKKQNSATRSLLSLFIYALLFYFIFDQNIVYIAAILVVLIIHELGHFAFMKWYGYSNVKIFIVPLLGAFTSGKKQVVSQKQLALIILGGPVPGIIIGCVLFWLNRDWQNDTVKMLYQTFLFINILNCLPFHPLDGGRLIETLFFNENYLIRRIFGIISVVVLGLLFLYQQNFILLIVPVLITLELMNEHKHHKIREYLKQENIRSRIEYENLTNEEYWLIRDCVLLSFPKKYAGVSPGVHQYSAIEPLLVQHVSAVLQVHLKNDLKSFSKVAFLLFYLLLFILPIALYAFA